MRLFRLLAVCLTVLLWHGCSVTRHVAEGEYFLQKVTVESDRETPKRQRITPEEFESYIRQTPNVRFLGTNLYVWVYNSANPDKHNRWNNFKRRFGKAPVLFDSSLTERSAQNMKAYMNLRGYYSSSVDYEVDTVRRPRRAYVTYRAHHPLGKDAKSSSAAPRGGSSFVTAFETNGRGRATVNLM